MAYWGGVFGRGIFVSISRSFMAFVFFRGVQLLDGGGTWNGRFVQIFFPGR